MMNLSQSHPDIDPEIFTVLELGISCSLPELSGLYFSGLKRHSGSQPLYHSPRTCSQIYYRLTLICYPPRNILHNGGSLAFADPPHSNLLSENEIDELSKMTREQLLEFVLQEGKFQRKMKIWKEQRELW
jgi:hypothetical protein